MTTPPTPADWYPDPEDPNGLRYFDGTAWTEHRAPAVAPAAPTAAAEPAEAAPVGDGSTEQATSVVRLPEQPTSGLDQPTSVIRQRPAVDPLDTSTPLPVDTEAPSGAHRAPDADAPSSPPPVSSVSYEQPPTYQQPPPYEPAGSYGAPQGTPYPPAAGYEQPPSYEQPAGGPPPGGSNKKVLFGVLGGAAALILVVALVLVYFFVIKDDDKTTAAPASSSKSSSSASKTATSKSTTSATAAPTGGQTIDEYAAANGITEVDTTPGEDGAPAVSLAIPDGWEVLDTGLPEYAYSGIAYTGADADVSVRPSIFAYMTKFTGNVDNNALFALAPNELLALDNYEPVAEGTEGDLGGFQAYALAGTYVQEGVTLFVAQKTVLIPAGDGTYLLRLYAYSTPAQQNIVGPALDTIDAGTTIG